MKNEYPFILQKPNGDVIDCFSSVDDALMFIIDYLRESPWANNFDSQLFTLKTFDNGFVITIRTKNGLLLSPQRLSYWSYSKWSE